MRHVMGHRRRRTSTIALAAFNLVMVVAVGVVLVLTETSWNGCLAEVEQGRLSQSLCNGNLMDGQAAVFFLLVPLWVLGDLAFAAVFCGGDGRPASDRHRGPGRLLALAPSACFSLDLCPPFPTWSQLRALLSASLSRRRPPMLGARTSLPWQPSQSAVLEWC